MRQENINDVKKRTKTLCQININSEYYVHLENNFALRVHRGATF